MKMIVRPKVMMSEAQLSGRPFRDLLTHLGEERQGRVRVDGGLMGD